MDPSQVNDSDEEGILEGRWDGEYGDGVAPYKWTGSVRILEEYVKSGYKPVKYGQCWVFSALVTTGMKCIYIGTTVYVYGLCLVCVFVMMCVFVQSRG